MPNSESVVTGGHAMQMYENALNVVVNANSANAHEVNGALNRVKSTLGEVDVSDLTFDPADTFVTIMPNDTADWYFTVTENLSLHDQAEFAIYAFAGMAKNPEDVVSGIGPFMESVRKHLGKHDEAGVMHDFEQINNVLKYLYDNHSNPESILRSHLQDISVWFNEAVTTQTPIEANIYESISYGLSADTMGTQITDINNTVVFSYETK